MMAPGRRTGAPPPKWSPALSLEDMDKSGIATSILSIAQPGVWYGNNVDEARTLARELNEYGAKLVRTIPAASGSSPASPRPTSEGSLKEIEYALDVLKADGIGLSDQLPGQISRRSRLRAGLRGAQPPQGRRLRPSDHA